MEATDIPGADLGIVKPLHHFPDLGVVEVASVLVKTVNDDWYQRVYRVDLFGVVDIGVRAEVS